MADQVTYLHSAGGLLNGAVVAELRNARPEGPAAVMAEPGRFNADGKVPDRRQLEEDIEFAYRTAEAGWSVLSDSLENLEVGRLRERLLLPLLRELGFDPVYQKARLLGGDSKPYEITHLGWEPDGPPMILTNKGLDDRTGRARSVHQEMQAFLNQSDATWGIVANGREMRLLRDYYHTSTQGAVVVDLADLFEAGSFPDFRAFYRLAHASRFQPAEGASSLLEHLYTESLAQGVAIGRALQPQVRRALTELLNGMIEGDASLHAQLQDDPAFGRGLYGELLTVLYRILFLLFAEQRGLLFGANDIYHDSYSVSRLRDLAASRRAEPDRADLWEGLKATFRAFAGDEDAARALGVPAYNGQLFDPKRTAHLNEASCRNDRVLNAFRALTTVEMGGVTQYVDYRHLGVEELGTVYESLLNYTIRIATQPVAADGVSYRPGQAYLTPLSLKRAELGAYYTPPTLVDLTLSKALDEIIDTRLVEHAGDSAAQEAVLLDLRVIDPACGSAAFLVGTIDRIAKALATVRVGDGVITDTMLQHARRDVLQHCIYGADIDPFAVELAKVALWIHCAVSDLPLTFLDHKIVCGDSLVGWPMFDLPKEIPTGAYKPPKGTSKDDRVKFRAARDRNEAWLGQFAEHQQQPDPDGHPTLDVEFLPLPHVDLTFPDALTRDETTVGDVRAKAAAYERYRNSPEYRQAKLAADLWTAAFFWTPTNGTFPTSKEYHGALAGTLTGWEQPVAETLQELNPLHWPLVFPDIHDRGGFDLVIGNPPWEQFENREQEFFAAAGRFDISDLTGEDRKKAIEKLVREQGNEQLAERWGRYVATNVRMNSWAKESTRFVRTTGKVNTYILFTELATQLSGREGWASIVVKSGIATDDSQTAVWHPLLDRGRVRSVVDVVNGGRTGRKSDLVFPAVDAKERFSVLTVGPPRTDGSALAVSMMSFGMDDALTKDPIVLTAADVAIATPNSRTLLSAPDKGCYNLALSLHRRFPILGLSNDGAWQTTMHILFNWSRKSAQNYQKRETLEADGWTLGVDKVFRFDDQVAVPVLEGQLVNMFDHRAKSYERYTGTKKYGKTPGAPEPTDSEKAKPAFEIEPRYWMLKNVADTRIEATVGDKAMVAIRDVGAPWRNQRTARAALIPRYPATHTLPILAVPQRCVAEFVGVFNSTSFDFLARVHMPGGHLALTWILAQIAIPGPGLDPRISELAERLSITSQVLADAYSLPLHTWDPAQREKDRVRLDALVAKTAYGLTRSEYELVLDAFEVMAREQTKQYGEYRFKRLCLDAYDRI